MSLIGNNVHFSARKTPGEKIPTDLQSEKAPILFQARKTEIVIFNALSCPFGITRGVPQEKLPLNPLTPVPPVTNLGLSSTSDVITFDQN